MTANPFASANAIKLDMNQGRTQLRDANFWVSVADGSKQVYCVTVKMDGDAREREAIAKLTPSDEDLEAYSTAPPLEWYKERW